MKNRSDYIFQLSELPNTKQKILFVARNAVLSGGLPALEFKGIAQKSGVGRATLYRHFSNQSDLIYALLDIEGRTLVAPYYDLQRQGFMGLGLEKFQQTLMQFHDANLRFPEFFRLLATADAHFGNDQSAEHYAKIFQNMFAQLFLTAEPAQFLIEGQADGSVRDDISPTKSANAAIAAAVSTILSQKVNPGGIQILRGGYSGAEILQEVIRALCAGLE